MWSFLFGAVVFGTGVLFGVAISETNLKRIMHYTSDDDN